jgi:hypothetical protein
VLERLAERTRSITVERHPARPWSVILRHASQFDAAIIVGNHNPVQLPSKAIQYLTLPIPRIALVNGDPDDALTCYLSNKPAWAVVPAEDPDPAARVRTLLASEWQRAAFTPPLSESWTVVDEVLREFILQVTGAAGKPAAPQRTKPADSRGRCKPVSTTTR